MRRWCQTPRLPNTFGYVNLRCSTYCIATTPWTSWCTSSDVWRLRRKKLRGGFVPQISGVCILFTAATKQRIWTCVLQFCCLRAGFICRGCFMALMFSVPHEHTMHATGGGARGGRRARCRLAETQTGTANDGFLQESVALQARGRRCTGRRAVRTT